MNIYFLKSLGKLFLMLLFVFTRTDVNLYAQQMEHLVLSSSKDTGLIMQQMVQAQQIKNKNPDEAMRAFSHLLRQSQAINFEKGIRNALVNIMQLYYEKGNYERSVQIAQTLIRASDSVKNKDAFFMAYYGSALAFHRLEQSDKALNAYMRALFFLADTSRLSITIYSNIGELFHRMNEKEKAMEYFRQAIHKSERYKWTNDLAMVSLYINMGTIADMLGRASLADSSFSSAIRVAQFHRNLENLYAIKRLQADIYNRRGYPNKALLAVKEARALLAKSKLKDRLSVSYQLDMYAGEAYIQLRNYDVAESYLLKAFHVADTNAIGDRAIIAHKLSRLYDSIGNYKKASEFLRTTYALSDKINDKEIKIRFNEAETRYRSAEKDKDLALKSMALSRQAKDAAVKNLVLVFISSGCLILFILCMGIYLYYRRKQKINRAQKEVEQIKAIMRGEESERVRLARELHDGIGGMLTAIKLSVGSIKKEHPEVTWMHKVDALLQMLQDTSSEVRTTAHNLMPDTLIRYGLQDAIGQYLSKINESHNIRIDFHVPFQHFSAIEMSVELVIYRTVQELIQNALKHAEATHIEIQLLEYDNILSLTVEDNGKGFVAESYPATGFGLENLKYRVNALHGEIEIDSRPGNGTTTRVSFNLAKLKLATAL